MIEAIRKQYDELQAKISETEVEEWTKLVDAEREHVLFPTTLDFTYPIKVKQAMKEDATRHYHMLRDTLIGLNKPIMQMSDQVSIIQDNFNSRFYFT